MLRALSLRTKVQLGVIILLIIFILSLFFSQSADPSIAPLFALKRVQEKVFMKLKTTPGDRLEYMSVLLNSRLNELNSIVRNENYDHVLKSSLRYSTLAGQITDGVLTNNLTLRVDAVKKQFEEHLIILNNINVFYPKNTDNLEYKYIEDDINYLKIYLDKLSTL